MLNNLPNSLIIIGAEYLIFLIPLLAIIYFFQQDKDTKKKLFLFGTITLPLIYLIAKIASMLYFNPRPFVVDHFIPLISHAVDNGFPSDHTLLSSAVAMVIFYFNRKLGTSLLVLALAVGISRVLAGVHHLVDILGSISISILVSLFVYYLILPHFIKTFFIKNNTTKS